MAELHVIAPTITPEIEKLRVGAYVRVSTDSEDQENSFLTQYDYYSNLIQSKEEWEFVDMYADEGITGTVIQLGGSLTGLAITDHTIVAEAGVPLPFLARKAAE